MAICNSISCVFTEHINLKQLLGINELLAYVKILDIDMVLVVDDDILCANKFNGNYVNGKTFPRNDHIEGLTRIFL